MPLFDMSPNIQESEAAGRKRSHDQFTEAAFQVKQEVTEECNGSLPATAVKQENCSSQGKQQSVRRMPQNLMHSLADIFGAYRHPLRFHHLAQHQAREKS